MDLFDKLALSMRKFEPRTTLKTHDKRFELTDLIEMFSKQSILELSASSDGKAWTTRKPDSQRKLKVSLLDSVSDLTLPADAWFNVGQTAPTGDYSKVHIQAFGRGQESLGQIDLLLGRRDYSYYYTEDPVLDQLAAEAKKAAATA